MKTEHYLCKIFLLGEFHIVAQNRVFEARDWRLKRAPQLLKMLALAPKYRLAVDTILDALWDGHEPKAARHSLHQALSVARAQLSTLPEERNRILQWDADWIVLCPEDRVWVDVDAFQNAAANARRARTPEAYQNALSLYAGELLPQDRYAEWTQLPRARLRELQLNLRVELAALYTQEYLESDARAVLESVVADDPLREDAARMLMSLYARNGQPNKALRAYEALRAQLESELNVAPEPATQQLYEKIRMRQTRTAPVLPALPLTRLVGRDPDRARIEQLIQRARLVTLVGPAGCGKTRLALECAHHIAPERNVYWIDLAPLENPALLPNVVAGRLGIQEQGAYPVEQRIFAFLQNEVGLLVLDNCEHLIGSAARFAKQLLAHCGEMRVLATSRERLRLIGESVWDVGTLPYPRADEWLDGETQRPYDSVQLFIERARALVPLLELGQENAPHIAAICRRLEGIPLALELAAARVNALSVQQIQSALDDALPILARGERAELPRHSSLRAALEWSFDLLSASEQKLWMRLGVLRGDFSLEAAVAVCWRRGDPPVFELLSALIDKSMVQTKLVGAEMKYRLLETMRQYALEKLQAAGELEMQRAAHYAYFAWLAEQADAAYNGANQVEWYMRVSAEIENLRAALEWSKSAPEKMMRLCAAMWRYWYVRGLLAEGRVWLEEALRHTQANDAVYARVLVGGGALCWAQGDLAQAEDFCVRGRELASATAERSAQGWAELVLGIIAQSRAEFELAAQWQARSVESFASSDDVFGRAFVIYIMGITNQTRGNVAEARANFEFSLALHRNIGNVWGMAMAQTNFGILEQMEGNFEPARARLTEAYNFFDMIDAEVGQGVTSDRLGVLALYADELDRAADLLTEGLQHFRKSADQAGIARAWNSMAQLEWRRGDVARALEYARKSVRLRYELQEWFGIVECLDVLAQIAFARGDDAQAVQLAGAADQLRALTGTGQFLFEREFERRMRVELCARHGKDWYEHEWSIGNTRDLVESVQQAIGE